MNLENLVWLLAGGILTLATETYILYRARKNEKKDELLSDLSSLINNLNLAKEYWFLIVEANYMAKYDDAVRSISLQERRVLSDSYNQQVLNDLTNFENYRLKLIEINAQVQSDISAIRTNDRELATILFNKVRQLKLSGWKIPDNLIGINETTVRKGIPRDYVSHIINRKLQAKDGYSYRVDGLVKQIGNAMMSL